MVTSAFDRIEGASIEILTLGIKFLGIEIPLNYKLDVDSNTLGFNHSLPVYLPSVIASKYQSLKGLLILSRYLVPPAL